MDLLQWICIGISNVIAGLALLVSWFEYRRNRSHLKIRLQFHLKTKESEAAFLVSVVNSGRRPVSVEKVLLRLRSGETWNYPPRDLYGKDARPIELAETIPYPYLFPLQLMPRTANGPLDIKQVEVYDTLGKKYICRVSRTLRSQIQREWTAEAVAAWRKTRN